MGLDHDENATPRAGGASGRTGRPDHAAIDSRTADAWCTEFHARRDARLRTRIVEAHQWLVRICARPMARRHEPMDDLVQVGNIGLIKAVDRFDPVFAVSFRTFASSTITGELRRHFRSVWRVHVPRSLQERYLLVTRASERLCGQLGHWPSAEEVASSLDLQPAAVREAFGLRSALVVDPIAPMNADGVEREVAHATLPPVDADDSLALRAAVKRLPLRERTIVYLSFFRQLTQAEIGERLGMSQVQVSRLLRRGVWALRALLDEEAVTAG